MTNMAVKLIHEAEGFCKMYILDYCRVVESSEFLLGVRTGKENLLRYVINSGQLPPATLSYTLFISLSGVSPTGHFLK